MEPECKECSFKDFVLSDLYCQGCIQEEESETIMYHATLNQDYYNQPRKAILDLEIPSSYTDDQKVLFAAERLLTRFRVNIAPIVDDYGIVETLMEECNGS